MIIARVMSFPLCTLKQKETYGCSTNSTLVIMQFTVLRSDKTALHLTVQTKPFFTETCSIGCLFNIFNSNILLIVYRDGEIGIIMVSISVCHAGCQGSSRVRSVCFRKVEIYQHAIDLCRWLVQQRLCHVLSCLCDNAFKRSIAVCRKSRVSCPISRPLSVPT